MKLQNGSIIVRCEGRKRKMGFGRKDKNAFSVHRSEEVMPNTLRHLVRQSSSMSSNEALEKSRDDDDTPTSATSRSRSSKNVPSTTGGRGGGSSDRLSSKAGGGGQGSSRKSSPGTASRSLTSSAASFESDADESRDIEG